MKRIDFVGSPGAGKTTALAALMQRRTHDEEWSTVAESELACARERARMPDASLKHALAAHLSYLPGCAWAGRLLVQSLVAPLSQDALWSKRREWQLWAAVILKRTEAAEDSFKTMRDIRALVDRMSEVALMERCAAQTMVICEDSLTQRIGMIVGAGAESGAVYAQYRATAPPAGIVHFTASPEVLKERIRTRAPQKMIVRHRGLSEAELYEAVCTDAAAGDHIVEYMRHSNVPVLTLESTWPINEIADLIDTKLSEWR